MSKRYFNILYAVFKGAKGYFNDRKHDRALKVLSKYYNIIEAKDNIYADWLPLFNWKEGSLWYYIRQVRYGQYISQKRQKQGEIDNMLSNKKLWEDKTEDEIREDVYAMVNGLTDTKKPKYVRKRGKDDRHRKSIKHR